MKRGDIRDPEYHELCRQFSFSAWNEFMPRQISPTDIDNMKLIECNRHFLWFEFKTVGTSMQFGQRLAFIRLLGLDVGYSALFVCEHPALSRVDAGHIEQFTVLQRRMDERMGVVRTVETELMPASELQWWIQQWFLLAEGQPNEFGMKIIQNAKE